MISLKDFLGFSDEEKQQRYSELAPEDQLLARMNDWNPNDTEVIRISEREEDIKNQANIMEQLKNAIVQETINLTGENS